MRSLGAIIQMNDLEDDRFVLHLGGCSLSLKGICSEGDTHLSAKCVGVRSFASIQNGFALTEQLFIWRDSLKKMYETLEGTYNFSIADPILGISFECQKLGQINVTVEMSENNLTESHVFKYEIDQSYLPDIIQKLLAFLESLPKFGCYSINSEDGEGLIILP